MQTRPNTATHLARPKASYRGETRSLGSRATEKRLIQGLLKAMLNNLHLSANFDGLLLFWKGPLFLPGLLLLEGKGKRANLRLAETGTG